MRPLPEILLLLVVLTNFAVLGTARLSTCIRSVAAQGLLLGLLALTLPPEPTGHALVIALGTVAVKTVLLPWFLTWAIREAAVRREIEPLVGFIASLLLGCVAVALSFAIANRLPLPEPGRELDVPLDRALHHGSSS